MTKSEIEKLEEQAQEKLAEAQKLLDEAGELAEQGGFTLSFAGGGDYVPKAVADVEFYREQATARIAEEQPDLDEDEREDAIEELMEDLRNENVPWQWVETGESEGGYWWQASTC